MNLWRLAALNPRLIPLEREQLNVLLQLYHRTAISRIWKVVNNNAGADQCFPYTVVDRRGVKLCAENATFKRNSFPGFVLALEACQMEWRLIDTEIEPLNMGYDNGANIPLLRNGCNILLSETLGAEAFITTTNLVNDITASLRGVRPKKSKKSHRKHKRRHQNTGVTNGIPTQAGRRVDRRALSTRRTDEISEEIDVSDESPQEGPSTSQSGKTK